VETIHEPVEVIYRKVYSFNNEEEELDFLEVVAKRRSKKMLITKEIEGKIGKSYLYMFHGEFIYRK
jgi:hypothetical protein